MDSDAFFWQTNGTESDELHNSIPIASYIQQQHPAKEMESPKSSSLVTTTSSPQSSLYMQSEEGGDNKQNDEGAIENALSIELANPDAIEPKARSYTCRICRMRFPNKSAVTVHSKMHTDYQGKPFRCNYCGKGFSTNFYLKQHERIHSGQKPYKCPMCDNSFKQLSHVQQHVRTHTGVRPYKCHWPGCGKAFLQQSHLRSHEARHTPKESGDRPFKCHWPDCGKSFGQLSNLKSHVARHTPGRSKGKKGSNSAKKSDVTIDPGEENENSFSLSAAQDVINQAAAAANIVPTPLGEDEAEIRPYLCPGCSKLYVREATFKKHLEECKTRLQMSISATASALGIEPPAVVPTSAELEFSNVLQIPLTIAEPVLKRPRLDVKEEEVIATIKSEPPQLTLVNHQQQQEHNINTSTHHSIQANSNPVSLMRGLHVKKEVENKPQVSNSSFVDHRRSSVENNFAPDEVINSVYIHGSEPQRALQNPNFIQADNSKPSHILDVEPSHTSSAQLHTQNLILTTTDTDMHGAVPLIVTQPTMSTQSLDITQHQNDNITKENPTSEHSTINQAAIRWQWDQPVPRLNFP